MRINADRLISRLETLGEIGQVIGPAGERGCARLALTDADRQGRDLVVSWMRELDLDIAIDAIGNVFATYQGQDPNLAPVMTGSHIDTVRTGGRFDGNLGVLAGLEVIQSLQEANLRPERSVVVAFFTDEEGARFAPDMLGSLVYVGGMRLEDALDISAMDDGARLGDELQRIGYSGSVPCPGARFPDSFVELHIEQGPILEDEGIGIGVVEGVQGISWTELTISGQSAHAGTTPMRLRHDPVYAAAVITTFVRDLTRHLGGDQVGTVGKIDIHPNLVNVIGSQVTMTVDLRHTDERVLCEAEDRLVQICAEVASEEGVEISRRSLARFEPVVFDPDMVNLVEQVSRDLGYRTRRMPSGAGHDAQMLARVCPSAMIFVPSINGLSHNLAEDTHPTDVAAGAEVLWEVLTRRAGVPLTAPGASERE
jgi:beta-ureidopropionase / N-carbamoyl-L-amino-acid hydrolase